MMENNIELYRGPEDWRLQKAFEDFLNLGPGRNAIALWTKYKKLQESNPDEPVPSTDLREITQWVNEHGWGSVAIQADAETYAIAQKKQQECMEKVFEQGTTLGQKLINLGQKALSRLNPEDFTPADALKFGLEGFRLMKECNEDKYELAQSSASQQGSFVDQIRNVLKHIKQEKSMQINQVNFIKEEHHE